MEQITDDTKLTFKKDAMVFRAINHKLRQQMLEHLWFNGSTVTDLYMDMGLQQSVCSQHLAILRKAGLVRAAKSGKTVTYTVDVNRFNEYKAYADMINNCNNTGK
jgi:DNA-binding transcriptional ArsR family regulator